MILTTKCFSLHTQAFWNTVCVPGRSMGARAAVALGRHLCVKEEVRVQGLLCVSFPLHPPGQTHAHVKRSEDLRALSHIPVLFVSGTADNMCQQVSLVYGNALFYPVPVRFLIPKRGFHLEY